MNNQAIPGLGSIRTVSARDAGLPSETHRDSTPDGGEGVRLPGGEAEEVAFLLPGGEMAALERAAHRLGLTVGQLLRRLIRDHLAREGHSEPVRSAQWQPQDSVTGSPRR